jgi:hypothetical protein
MQAALRPGRGPAGLLSILIVVLAMADGAAALDAVPLPRARPVDPTVTAAQPKAATGESLPKDADGGAAADGASACRARLEDGLAVIRPLPPLDEPGGCGAADMVMLEAVLLADRSRVPLMPGATLRCSMAESVVAWIREDVAATAAELGSRLAAIETYDSYSCRGRNRVAGAKLSEHGRANALDLRAVRLADGKRLDLTDAAGPKPFRERMRAQACARFTTVLGPDSDGYHENHVHVDLAERRSGYRICQWAVRTPGDGAAAAVPLPLPRPVLEAGHAEPDESAPRAETTDDGTKRTRRRCRNGAAGRSCASR